MNFIQSLHQKRSAMLLALGLGLSLQAMPGLAVQPNQTGQEETYLYGQSRKPNQVQQGYVVFEQFGSTVVGASYYPRSEFRCFIGNLNSQSERVTGVMLASMRMEQAPINIDLSPLYPLEQLSQNDQRMLTACKQTAIKRQEQLPDQWQPIPAAWLQ
ncbi:hypothetical protein [Acaryochloris sp. CCMEE 5410]|uniref:hypothetical protein n=1 Tax=Acaryochloris sp. CCMEE 5410 TaxID=310037 RepID=UPI000584C20F|nr:hypothetical protein [Acaryochloris sp. CCMEE 5410]KAI9132831.1 hypothetical protein ON05_005400 [Acaryochloris sp. CCMEE 5410]